MKKYEVTFITKLGGEKAWMIHVEANNAKEACKITTAMWREKHIGHMFRPTARLLKNPEECTHHDFKQL